MDRGRSWLFPLKKGILKVPPGNAPEPVFEELAMKNEDFRRSGHQFVDWIADYFENVEKYPICSRVEPGDIRALVPAVPPARGEAMEAIFRDFETLLLPGITHWQHPGWFAYFPANRRAQRHPVSRILVVVRRTIPMA